MTVRDYSVERDKFSFDRHIQPFDFPCCACKHRHGTAKDEPCRTCDHNSGCVPDKAACVPDATTTTKDEVTE